MLSSEMWILSLSQKEFKVKSPGLRAKDNWENESADANKKKELNV